MERHSEKQLVDRTSPTEHCRAPRPAAERREKRSEIKSVSGFVFIQKYKLIQYECTSQPKHKRLLNIEHQHS